MKDKELLLEAIDSYDLYTPSERIVLKVLIELAVDDVAIISVLKLSKLSKVSRPIVYKALNLFDEDKLIERVKRPKSKVSWFNLKADKLNNIIKRHQSQENILNKAKI